jgi:hypothetical protein
LAEAKCIHAAGSIDKLCSLVLKTNFSEKDQSKLGDLIE